MLTCDTRSMTLVKVANGTRTPGAISGGTNPTTTSHTARGRIDEYSAYELANSLAVAGDRKILLLGASIAGGVTPSPSDHIIDGRDGLSALTDETILKVRARRAFVLAHEKAWAVLETTNA